MSEITSAPGKRLYIIFSLAVIIIVAADQLTKGWIRATLDIGEVFFQLGIFRIIHGVPNTGSAFGFFQGYTFALSIVSIVFLVILLLYVLFFSRRLPALNRTAVWLALGLIFGGAAGNLIDRLNPSLGGVTDFISVGWFAVFNVADSAITVGGLLLGVYVVFFSDVLKSGDNQGLSGVDHGSG
jgi:signal peptidase II